MPKLKIDTVNIWYGYAIRKWITCALVVTAHGLEREKIQHDSFEAAVKFVAAHYEGEYL